MVTDGVEIEDAGNKDRDLENTIEELDSKALVSKNKISEAEGEKLPCVVANAKKSDDAGQCLKGLEKNLVDITNKEKEDKMSPPTETNEPMDIEGSTGQVDAITKNIDESNPEKNVDDEAMNKQRDVENEVPEHNASNGGVVKDVKLAENGVDGGNPVENVEENCCDDFSVEKQEDNENTYQNAATGSDLRSTQVPIDVSPNEAPPSENTELDKVLPGRYQEMEATANLSEGKALNELKDKDEQIPHSTSVADGNTKTIETASKLKFDHLLLPVKHEAATPSSLIRYSPAEAGDHSGETDKTVFSHAALPLMAEDDDGTPEEQAAFMKEIESFYRERAMDFKPPKFYGQPLNCLKLWRAVIRLGGYDRVTGSKLWRQVGESFHPPKTCTTVSWTFRIFYEKSLLEYEKHKIQSGELQLPVAALNDVCGAETESNGFQGAGSGRARRDAAARAMQGWHVQRLFGNGEDKSICNTAKREKIVKSIGSLKQKRSNEVEHPVKAARVETSKQLAITVVDVGRAADWVKINVRQMKDSFEVYALVPGLLREEVRVQSDPAGRLVITGEPEQVDNPWGITPFKKVVILPSRIDPLQTSAVVSLHGRLFIRVPFEQSDG